MESKSSLVNDWQLQKNTIKLTHLRYYIIKSFIITIPQYKKNRKINILKTTRHRITGKHHRNSRHSSPHIIIKARYNFTANKSRLVSYSASIEIIRWCVLMNKYINPTVVCIRPQLQFSQPSHTTAPSYRHFRFRTPLDPFCRERFQRRLREEGPSPSSGSSDEICAENIALKCLSFS